MERTLDDVRAVTLSTLPDLVAYFPDINLNAVDKEPIAPFFDLSRFLINMTRTIVLERGHLLRFSINCDEEFEVR